MPARLLLVCLTVGVLAAGCQSAGGCPSEATVELGATEVEWTLFEGDDAPSAEVPYTQLEEGCGLSGVSTDAPWSGWYSRACCSRLPW